METNTKLIAEQLGYEPANWKLMSSFEPITEIINMMYEGIPCHQLSKRLRSTDE